MPRLYSDISEDYEKKFLFIKGCLAAKSNGVALEEMIDRVEPEMRKELSKKAGRK